MKRKPFLVLVVSLIALSVSAAEYPEIRNLSRDDLLFVQLQDDVESFYRVSRGRQPTDAPPLSIFTYRRKPGEDLFFLNARLGIPYDTLATLNGIESASGIGERDRVLVASQPGIFVSDPPKSELEHMILGSRLDRGIKAQKLVVARNGKEEGIFFFPDSRFSDVERAYFLNILFRFPIAQGSITSRYGPRPNPFSGHPEFHNGIDIGAPEGTEVHATREGKVTERGFSPTLGNYLILTHPGDCRTVYGHLSAFNVTLGEEVLSGAVIGKVGKTGLATGPHLHFEVRRKGGNADPIQYFRVKV